MVDPGFTKGGGGGGGRHKILDLLSLLPHIYKINKTTRWEVVENSASPKRVQIINKTFFGHNFLCFIFYLRPHPPLIQKGGGGTHSTCIIFIFLWTRPHLTKKGGGMCMPPPRSTYNAHRFSLKLFGKQYC